MDIDVKKGLQDVLNICELSLKDSFIEDIYNFIVYISIDNKQERFDVFSKEYLNDEYNSSLFSNIDVDNQCRIYAAVSDENKKKVFQFFSALGKHFLFSRYDKKDIDKDKFLTYIASFKTSIKTTNNDVKDNKMQQAAVEQEKAESAETVESEENLEDLLDELNSKIGLDSVKQEVQQIINIIKVREKAKEFGESPLPLSLHLVFAGNPGTGKTTIARLLAKIYKCLGVLSTGQFVETDRGQLVGGYVGSTAIQTQKKIDEAMGGILFIDEAYTLTHGKGENDFGQEAVDTILKAMEDKRDDFIVIVAGYTNLMKEFISSNPGLKSRFNKYINFEDYIPEELFKIFVSLCDSNKKVLSSECKDYLMKYFTDMYENRGDDYANGRYVRNYFEKVYTMQANRIQPDLETISYEQFQEITIDDLENAANIKSDLE